MLDKLVEFFMEELINHLVYVIAWARESFEKTLKIQVKLILNSPRELNLIVCRKNPRDPK